MNINEAQVKGAELLKSLIEKSWDDSTFKAQLVTNPVTTIEKFTGESLTVPEGKQLVVEDQTDESKIFINIPAQPNFDELELTDEQLEQVAGGEVAGTVFAVAGACAILYSVGRGIYDGMQAQ